VSATAWSTIASLATALGTLILAVATFIEAHEAWTVELLYGDHEGGQRVISRFTVLPVDNPETKLRWLATASRHWNIDRPDPR
jgi:hypothetical protein